MTNSIANRKRSKSLSSAILVALALSACSRDQKPIAEAVKPAQKTLEAAKGMEQTLQKAHKDRDAHLPKE